MKPWVRRRLERRKIRECLEGCEEERTVGQALGIWALGVLIGIDQLGNTILGGNPDETISSRLGRLKLRHGGTIPWRRPVAKAIDAMLEWLDPGHAIRAIEWDEV